MRPFIIALVCLLTLPILAAKTDWPTITPADLAATPPTDDPDIPAEILYRRIDVDLSDIPLGRKESEYIRYKIYKPEKSDSYTRISRYDYGSLYSSTRTDLDITARLTLPDGTTRIFTKADIKERPAYKGASENTLLGRLLGGSGYEVGEKFLAIKGVTAGAILEYRIETSRDVSSEYEFINAFYAKFFTSETKSFQLQNPDLPIRKVEFFGRSPSNKRYYCRYYTLNRSIGSSTIEDDKKKRTVHIQATDVPPSNREPFAGPNSYYALTLLQCIDNTETTHLSRQSAHVRVSVDVKTDGPWSPVASDAYIKLVDCSEVTRAVKNLAAEITKTATTPTGKAELIYAYVQEMCREYAKRPRQPSGEAEFIKKIDDLVEFKKKPDLVIPGPNEFMNLCHALYKASEIESRGVLLPDRSRFLFHPQLVTKSALPISGLMVKIDGQWKYALPHVTPSIPFGSLPWYSEGQVGLIIKDGPQEFIEIPNSKSSQTRINNIATFELTETGSLIGEAKRKFVGNHAYQIRQSLKNQKGNKAKAFFQRMIEADFEAFKGMAGEQPGTEDEDEKTKEKSVAKIITVLSVDGLNEGTAPIEVQYKIDLPNYAIMSADRIILRPSVFRLKGQSPFTATTRKNAVRFPFTWQEVDSVTIKYPAGFKLEAANMPSLPSDQTLFYRNQLTNNADEHTLKLRRESVSELINISAEKYTMIKGWYDGIEKADSYEVVLSKQAASVPTL